MQRVFVIESGDNVATALEPLEAGAVQILGRSTIPHLTTGQGIPAGHKIAVTDIGKDAPVFKYGHVIGCATQAITAGDWVHLHNLRSNYDERSSSLDGKTGAPTDTRAAYE